MKNLKSSVIGAFALGLTTLPMLGCISHHGEKLYEGHIGDKKITYHENIGRSLNTDFNRMILEYSDRVVYFWDDDNETSINGDDFFKDKLERIATSNRLNKIETEFVSTDSSYATQKIFENSNKLYNNLRYKIWEERHKEGSFLFFNE